ncbi:hypothetical protein ZWY2020_046693 [Hordeum vulgare]|nr:hypothetical protein ZWY2020_041878 [Hordeum vulgare]KAI4992201.1 hypothetical protein ZWY2020_046693 [Hordeum vulgare]
MPASPAQAEVPIPLEQVALLQDNDPADMSGLLAVPAQQAKEVAEVIAQEAVDQAAALAAVRAQEEEHWGLDSTSYKDGSDDGGDVADRNGRNPMIVDLASDESSTLGFE